MTHFRTLLGTAMLMTTASAHAAPANTAISHDRSNMTPPTLATLAPEGSTATIMLVAVGLIITTRRNRRNVRSVQA